MQRQLRLRHFVNYFMFGITGACAFLTVSVFLVILGYLAYKGAGSLHWEFFTQLPVPPGEPGGGIAHAIVGSAKLLVLAATFGVPLGLLASVYLAEFGNGPIGSVVRYATDLLNGVPSIVLGILVYSVVVVSTQHFSLIAGALALSLILVPATVRPAEQFLRSVPNELREGALALGASPWKATTTIVIPAALPGIVTALIIGFARIAGESAPLLFTSLGNQFWSPGWNHPTASLPVIVYVYSISPYENWQQHAWAGALVLILLVLAMNTAARSTLSQTSVRRRNRV